MNQFIQQLVRDIHLTFSKKLRELIIKIYGHEGLSNNQNLSHIANCTIFNEELYRLQKIEWTDLAYRKLLNPFKSLELLITIPLELLPWALGRFVVKFTPYCMSIDSSCSIKNIPRLVAKGGLASIIFFSIAAFPFINLASNIVTGIVRRFLAPVRYIIRPSIEMAKLHPKTFLVTLGFSLILTAVSAGVFPLVAADNVFLVSSLGIKIATITGGLVAMETFLLKASILLQEVPEAFKRALISRFKYKTQIEATFASEPQSEYDIECAAQWEKVDTLNGLRGYPLFSLVAEESITLEELDSQYSDCKPMLIQNTDYSVSIYGAGPGNISKLTKIYGPSSITRDFIEKQSMLKSVEKQQKAIGMVFKNQSQTIPREVYFDIACYKGHFVERKPGTTVEISRALHAINPDLVELKPVERQDPCYSFALFMGAESLFYPKKNQDIRAEFKQISSEEFRSIPPSSTFR
jgi:hypothetical protein